MFQYKTILPQHSWGIKLSFAIFLQFRKPYVELIKLSFYCDLKDSFLISDYSFQTIFYYFISHLTVHH